MSTVLVRFKVNDYQNWKSVFSGKADWRKSNGVLSERYYQELNDPNQVTLLLEWDSADNARNFFVLPELRQAQQRGGVMGNAGITFPGRKLRLNKRPSAGGRLQNRVGGKDVLAESRESDGIQVQNV